MSQFMPICLYCKHYHREVGEDYTCDVFPDGIPPIYTEGMGNHFEPHPEDGGVQFELAPDMDYPEIRQLIKRRKKASS
jgi:hypothetical protein